MPHQGRAGVTDEKDQISFTVAVIDETNFKSFPQTYVDFNILKLRSAGPGGDEVVVVVEDEQGNTTDAVRKKALLAQVDGNPGAASRTADPQQAVAEMKRRGTEMINRLPMLTDDASILPGRKATFITCFNYVPGATRAEEVSAWFEARNAVTLGFFDVPVSRDVGGGVTKKSSFQVKLLVKVWKDRYEYVARPETKSWTPVVKSSVVVREPAEPGAQPAAPARAPAPSSAPAPK